MRKRISWLAALVGASVLWLPQSAPAQGPAGEVPPPQWAGSVPWPFGRPRLDQGGFYIAGEFLYWRQSNPLGSQPLAFRGVTDFDGTIHTALGIPGGAGDFIGSHANALDVNYVSGPTNFEPGFNFTFGYRFESGIALEFRWIHINENILSATASLAPPGLNSGPFQAETFLTSPVYNFSLPYAGPGNTTGQGSAIGLFGIWDGSVQQTIDFIQRFDMWELNFRVPMQESECWRTYGLFGPRLATIWERFKWRVTNQETDGSTPPEDIAVYTNVVSNRLYGVHGGVGNEWTLGDTPIGAFSVSLDLQASLFADFVKGRPKYQLSDKSTAAQHGRNFFSLVPECEGALNLWWYPYEGVVIRLGYEAMGFFNTYSSPRPVDFNFGAITPEYRHEFLRIMDGVNAGIGFIF
jgi:hypothetical protein